MLGRSSPLADPFLANVPLVLLGLDEGTRKWRAVGASVLQCTICHGRGHGALGVSMSHTGAWGWGAGWKKPCEACLTYRAGLHQRDGGQGHWVPRSVLWVLTEPVERHSAAR